jgi:cobalt-zinc-cadmium efflux system membrane fusion protein
MKPYLSLLGLILVGCQQQAPAPATASKESPEKKASAKPNEVVLDPNSAALAGIKTEVVRMRTTQGSISATGQLIFNEDQSWSVGSLLDGRIVATLAKVGDRVQKGQVLARIHSHEIHDSRARYTQAEQELRRSESSLAQAQRFHDRAQRLLDLKASSREQLELAEQQLRNAQAGTEHARIELEKERVHLTEYLDVPLKPKEGVDEDIPIRAPASGVVIARKTSIGAVTTAGAEVYRIANPSTLWMIANVNETDIAAVRPGGNVRISVRAYPDRAFPGRILQLGESLDPETRTLQVRVSVPNAAGLLKPEMYGTATLAVAGTREMLTIPAAAVQDLNGNRAAFIEVRPGHYEIRALSVGNQAAGEVEVVAGIRAQDRVVTEGSFILKSQLLKGSLDQ